jgi:NADPH2:quinone reductase
MRAIVYSETGGPEVLRLVERPVPEPGPGEVRIAVRVSGVNPTDWKARSGGQLAFPEVVPNQDGSGTIDAVGEGVDAARVGERVWMWEAAWQRANGTAQQSVVLPERQAVQLPDDVSFDVGASLGIPALTAHPLSDRLGAWAEPAWPGCSRCADRVGCRRRRCGRPCCDPARALARGARDRDRQR